MREILFRGKRTDNGKWVEGELLHDMQDRPHIYWKTTKELPIVFSNHAIVRPATVGQFTGLIDKNGTKIFEGDIVKYGDHLMLVAWYEFLASFMLAFSVDGNYHETISNSQIYLEVIGNIHDNPELVQMPLEVE